jgi:hypothetical protein
LKLKFKISKSTRLKFVIFAALMGISIFFDIYFEKHPLHIDEVKTEQNMRNHRTFDLYNQVNSISVKMSVQSTAARTFFDKSHSKFLNNCNPGYIKLLQNEKEEDNISVNLSGLQLIFGHYFHLFPDDDPPLC